ncbi:MAG: hypothetical protein H7Y88_13445 [Phycisphaerales bacterium]|nr:hypothetical protein [Phycisphaerales bacterium]
MQHSELKNHSPSPLAAAALAIPLALAACAGPLNHDTAIGDQIVLPALSPAPIDPEPAEPSQPSLTSLSRDNWEPQMFAVPPNTIEHQPTYSSHARVADEMARQRGEYPTEDTAVLNSGDKSRWYQVGEAILEPFASALDIVMFIPRALVKHPWETESSPRDAYQRAPATTLTTDQLATEGARPVPAPPPPPPVPEGQRAGVER